MAEGTITQGRAKRSTAGNRMRELLEKAHQQDDDDMFKEEEDDEEFAEPTDIRDVYLDEFADTDDEAAVDEEAEERELRREEKRKAKGKGRATFDPLANQPKSKKKKLAFASTSDPSSSVTAAAQAEALALLGPDIDPSSMAPSTLLLALRKQRREAKRQQRSEVRRSNLRASTLKTAERDEQASTPPVTTQRKGRRAMHEGGEARGVRPLSQAELIAEALEEEERNKEELQKWLRREEERRELRRVGRKRVRGPRWTWISRTVGKVVEVIGEGDQVETKTVEVRQAADSRPDVVDTAVAKPDPTTGQTNKAPSEDPQVESASVSIAAGASSATVDPPFVRTDPQGQSPPREVSQAAVAPTAPVEPITAIFKPNDDRPGPEEAGPSRVVSAPQSDTPAPDAMAGQSGEVSTVGDAIPTPGPATQQKVAAEAKTADVSAPAAASAPVELARSSTAEGVLQTADTPNHPVEPSQYTRNYLILSQIPGGLPAEMALVLGSHVEWDQVQYIPSRNRPINRRRPICPFTGKIAKYRHPATMIPYADVRGYREIEAMLQNRYLWSEGGFWLGGEEDLAAPEAEEIEGWREAVHGGWMAGFPIPTPDQEEQEEAPEVEEKTEEIEVEEEPQPELKQTKARSKAKGKKRKAGASADADPDAGPVVPEQPRSKASKSKKRRR